MRKWHRSCFGARWRWAWKRRCISHFDGRCPSIGLEIGSLVCAGLSVIDKVAGKRLSHKLVKHRRIEAMARAKLNTILDIVSKALADGNSFYVGYTLVLDELQKFEDLKQEVRAEKSPQNMEELRLKFLEEGRKEALAKLSKS